MNRRQVRFFLGAGWIDGSESVLASIINMGRHGWHVKFGYCENMRRGLDPWSRGSIPSVGAEVIESSVRSAMRTRSSTSPSTTS